MGNKRIEARLSNLFLGVHEPSSPLDAERGAVREITRLREPVLLLPSRIPRRRVLKKWARQERKNSGNLPERTELPAELRPILHDLITQPGRATLSRYRWLFENWLAIAPSYSKEERVRRRKQDALMRIQERCADLSEASQQLLLAEWERRGFDSVLPTNLLGMARLLDRHFPDDKLLPVKPKRPENTMTIQMPKRERLWFGFDESSKTRAWEQYREQTMRQQEVVVSAPNRFARRADRRRKKDEMKQARTEASMRLAEGVTDRHIAAFFRFIDEITPGIEQQVRDERTRMDLRKFMHAERVKERRRIWEEDRRKADLAVRDLFRRKSKSVDQTYPFRNPRLVSILRFAYDDIPDYDRQPHMIRDIAVILDSIPDLLNTDTRFRATHIDPLLFSRSPEGLMAWRNAMKANERKLFFFTPPTDVDYAADVFRTAHRKMPWVILDGEPTKGYFRQLSRYWLKYLNAAGLSTIAGSVGESAATPELYEYVLDHAHVPDIRQAIYKAYGTLPKAQHKNRAYNAPNRHVVRLVELAYRHAFGMGEHKRLNPDQRVQIIELAWRLVNQSSSLPPVHLYAQSLLASANE